MNVYFLKFSDINEALSTISAGDLSGGGDLIKQTKEYFVDVVGEIVLQNQVGVDEDAQPIFEQVELEGFHVNILAEALPPELNSYLIETPSTPYRTFAGF